MSHCMRTNGKGQWQKENHFNIVELAHDHYFIKTLLKNCSDWHFQVCSQVFVSTKVKTVVQRFLCFQRDLHKISSQVQKWKRSVGVGVRKKSGYQTSVAFSSLLEATLAAANITLLNLQLNCLRSSCINSGSRFWKGRIMCGINKTLCSFNVWQCYMSAIPIWFSFKELFLL